MTGPERIAVPGWLLLWQQAATREQAQHAAQKAATAGATPDQLADAWLEWDELHGRQVQTVGAVRCACSHHRWRHVADTYRCRRPGCGCASYRAATEPTGIPDRFDDRYDPSPDPIDRRIS